MGGAIRWKGPIRFVWEKGWEKGQNCPARGVAGPGPINSGRELRGLARQLERVSSQREAAQVCVG